LAAVPIDEVRSPSNGGTRVNRFSRTVMMSAVIATLVVATPAAAATRTDEPSQVTAVNGWEATPISTIGEEIKGYIPPGIPDGMSAYAGRGRGVMSAFVNHELVDDAGYPYELANATSRPALG
jgi:hypothetical protein